VTMGGKRGKGGQGRYSWQVYVQTPRFGNSANAGKREKKEKRKGRGGGRIKEKKKGAEPQWAFLNVSRQCRKAVEGKKKERTEFAEGRAWSASPHVEHLLFFALPGPSATTAKKEERRRGQEDLEGETAAVGATRASDPSLLSPARQEIESWGGKKPGHVLVRPALPRTAHGPRPLQHGWGKGKGKREEGLKISRGKGKGEKGALPYRTGFSLSRCVRVLTQLTRRRRGTEQRRGEGKKKKKKREGGGERAFVREEKDHQRLDVATLSSLSSQSFRS